MRWALVYQYLFGGTENPRRQGTELLPADVFTFIQSIVQDPTARGMDAILLSLQSLTSSIVTVLMLIALGVMCMLFAFPIQGFRAENPIVTLVKMAGPWWLTVNTAAFYEWVVALGLYVIPTALGNAVAGTLGAGRTNLDAALFGNVLNDAMIMGVDLFRAAGLNPVNVIVVILLMVAAILAIAYGWWIWFKAGLFLIVLFAISPIPVLCLITPWTRGIFFRWLDCVVGFLFLKLLSVVFVALLLAVESQIVGIVVADTRSVVDKIGIIFCAICVFGAMFFAALDIPRLAGALSGGTVMHSGYGAVAFGMGWASRAWKGRQDRLRRERERQDRIDARNMAPATP